MNSTKNSGKYAPPASHTFPHTAIHQGKKSLATSKTKSPFWKTNCASPHTTATKPDLKKNDAPSASTKDCAAGAEQREKNIRL